MRLCGWRAAAAGLMFMSFACVHPRITRRYERQTQSTAATGEIEAALTAFATAIPEASAKATLLSLSERGQASLIRELGEQSKTSTALLEALGSPIEKAQKPEREVDRRRWTRRVVFSVENRSNGPADRISYARIRLNGLSEDARFESWTQFATKYDSADLGTLKLTEHHEGGAEVAAGVSFGKVGLSGRVSADQEENVKLSQRYVSLTGALSPTSADLIQQGAPGIDLTGNVAVDLTVKIEGGEQTDVFRFTGFQDEKGQPKPTSEVKIFRQAIRYLSAPRDLEVSAELTATIRKVLRGERTLTESDDRVDFRTGTTQPLRVVLVPAKEQVVQVWVLKHPSGALLHFARAGGGAELIRMDTFDGAVQLQKYLANVSNPALLAGETLQLPGAHTVFDTEAAKLLQVEIQTLNHPQ